MSIEAHNMRNVVYILCLHSYGAMSLKDLNFCRWLLQCSKCRFKLIVFVGHCTNICFKLIRMENFALDFFGFSCSLFQIIERICLHCDWCDCLWFTFPLILLFGVSSFHSISFFFFFRIELVPVVVATRVGVSERDIKSVKSDRKIEIKWRWQA